MTYRRGVIRLALLLAALAPLAACGPDDSTGACKDTFVSGDLVVTEVFADYAAPAGGTGTDDGKEWFEIYNNSDRPVSLKGVTVVHSKIDGSKPASHTIDDVTIAPGQFFTLGNATQDLLPPYVDYGFSADLGDFYNTGGGKLALKCGDQEIDSADYDAVKSGHARQLTSQSPPDYTLNDDQVNWCEAKDTEFELNNFGTPGSDSDCAPVIAGACTDNGVMRAVVSPAVGELVITEVIPNPAGNSDTTGEWFEVTALAPFDLNGLTLDRAGDTSGGTDVASAACLHVDAGDYALFAKSSDALTNGNLPPAAIMGSFGFSLVDGTVADPGDVQVMNGATVLDAVRWTSTRSGKSHQLSLSLYDATSNDDETSFCDGTTVYATSMTNVMDYGTPGAANLACAPTVQPGQCLDNGNPRAIVPPTAGNLVITEIMPHPLTANNGAAEWFEVTNIGGAPFDLNGLALDRDADSRAPDKITNANCVSVAAAGFALFARGSTASTNGGLPAVDATFGFGMLDSAGNLRVVDPTSCDTVTPFQCTTIFDAVTWASSLTGASSQLKPGMFTTANNDVAGNFCPATSTQTYGTAGNLGTPKAANACL